MSTAEVIWDAFTEGASHPVDLLFNTGAIVDKVLDKTIPEKTVVDPQVLDEVFNKANAFSAKYLKATNGKLPADVQKWLEKDHHQNWTNSIDELRKGFFEFRGDLIKIGDRYPLLYKQLKQYFNGQKIAVSNQPMTDAVRDYIAMEASAYNAYLDTVNWKQNQINRAVENAPNIIDDVIKSGTGVSIKEILPNAPGQNVNVVEMLAALFKNVTGIDLSIGTIITFAGVAILVLVLVNHLLNKI